RQTLAGAGLFYDPELIHLGNFREAAGYEGTRRLLALPDPPTAILTANNEMAAGAVRALAELRQAIGSDVSLITFDDARWAQYMVPPMTVVAQPVAEIGQTAVDILFRRLDREAASARPAVYTQQPYLIVRESTKPYQAKRK
ncbi:MAG: LacI family DNA-binding transcriptional regulator, partial [Bacteroidota bacterium]